MNNKLLITMLGLCVAFGMIVAPTQCINASYNGLLLCCRAIIPTLLPFFICVRILTKSGFAEKTGANLGCIMRPVFNLPGESAFAFLMGLISGYPMGAKCAVEIYENNRCTKEEAERIVCFCNNSGPMFVLGSVGVVMLHNKQAGAILLISHVLAALTLGVILGRRKKTEVINNTIKKTENNGSILSSAVCESVNLILYVCAYIVFFNILVTVLDYLGIIKFISVPLKLIGVDEGVSEAMCYGFFEMTNGISKLSALNTCSLRLPLISLLLGFSGLCIILQIIGITEQYNLRKFPFIVCKFFQGILSFIYTLIIINLPIALPTFSNKTIFKFTFLGNVVLGVLLVFASVTVISTLNVVIEVLKRIINIYKHKNLKDY